MTNVKTCKLEKQKIILQTTAIKDFWKTADQCYQTHLSFLKTRVQTLILLNLLCSLCVLAVLLQMSAASPATSCWWAQVWKYSFYDEVMTGISYLISLNMPLFLFLGVLKNIGPESALENVSEYSLHSFWFSS